MTGVDAQLLDRYAEHTGRAVITHLQQLADLLQGARVVHVNSTREGGGVAEILSKLVPLMRALGLDAQWEVIEGDPDFFHVTRSLHNGLQGQPVEVTEQLWAHYRDVNAANAERLRPLLEPADFVFVHDPQPAPLLALCPDRRGRWIWRCHIDVRRPHRPVWSALKCWVERYDASVFSLAEYAQPLPHLQFLMPPSIDPLPRRTSSCPPTRSTRCARSSDYDPTCP